MSKKNVKEDNIVKETKYCKIINQGKVGDDEYTYTIEKIYCVDVIRKGKMTIKLVMKRR